MGNELLVVDREQLQTEAQAVGLLKEIRDFAITIVLDKTRKSQLQAEGNEAAAFLKDIQGFEVTDQDGLEFLAATLKEIKGKKKLLEEERKSVTNPISQFVNGIRAWFDQAEGYYKLLEVDLKDKIARAEQANRDRNTYALREAEEAHRIGNRPAVVQALANVQTLQPIKGLSTREEWDFEIEDAGLVPREFCVPSMPKIREAMRAPTESGEPRGIPGVRFFKRTIVASRSA